MPLISGIVWSLMKFFSLQCPLHEACLTDMLWLQFRYSALLKVNVPGSLEVPPDVVQRIGRILAPGKF